MLKDPRKTMINIVNSMIKTLKENEKGFQNKLKEKMISDSTSVLKLGNYKEIEIKKIMNEALIIGILKGKIEDTQNRILFCEESIEEIKDKLNSEDDLLPYVLSILRNDA